MDVIEIDRVIVATENVDETTRRLTELLGVEFGAKINTAINTQSGEQWVDSRISPVGFDVVAPAEEDSDLHRFLDDYGRGLYGLTLRVSDVEAAEAELSEKGIDPVGSLSGEGFAEVFYHPRDFEGLFVALAEFQQTHPVEHAMEEDIVEE